MTAIIIQCVKTFFLLLVGHAMSDFALQTEAMAFGKNRFNGPPKNYDPEKHGPLAKVWPFWLSAHALISGGAVYIVTGVWWLGLAETVFHWWIDYQKTGKAFGVYYDQMLHILCKFLWTWMLFVIWTQ